MGVDLDLATACVVLLAVAISFGVSAAAGFGGSLILVPTLALVLGTRSGVALAALLLAGNNVVKILLYRRTLPFRASAVLVVLIVVGAGLGALALVSAPEDVVAVAVICVFAASFITERWQHTRQVRGYAAYPLAFVSGATSGFSGTSGPLKGLAFRALPLDRMHLVGGLSLASLAGDAMKTAIFAEAQLISASGYRLALVAVPLMVVASLAGRRVNRAVGERGFAGLFWAVMIGYAGRLILT
jgi:uncharacterized membrane protein YfcA